MIGIRQIGICRIDVHQWYHVEPGTRIELGAGAHPVIGASGTGETVLLYRAPRPVRPAKTAQLTHHEYRIVW